MEQGFINKRCPRCNGNIYRSGDFYGWYEQCLQCSFVSYLEGSVDSRKKAHNDDRMLLQQREVVSTR